MVDPCLPFRPNIGGRLGYGLRWDTGCRGTNPNQEARVLPSASNNDWDLVESGQPQVEG